MLNLPPSTSRALSENSNDVHMWKALVGNLGVDNTRREVTGKLEICKETAFQIVTHVNRRPHNQYFCEMIYHYCSRGSQQLKKRHLNIWYRILLQKTIKPAFSRRKKQSQIKVKQARLRTSPQMQNQNVTHVDSTMALDMLLKISFGVSWWSWLQLVLFFFAWICCISEHFHRTKLTPIKACFYCR